MGNRITRSAQMRACTLRLSDGTHERSTVVFCHAPSASKGIGLKSPDWWGAYGCAECHDIVDGRTPHRLTDLEIARAWLRGIHETQRILFEEGILRL